MTAAVRGERTSPGGFENDVNGPTLPIAEELIEQVREGVLY